MGRRLRACLHSIYEQEKRYTTCMSSYAFLNMPLTSEIRNNTMKTKNSILAMPAAPAAMPVKPKMAAKMATTKNTTE